MPKINPKPSLPSASLPKPIISKPALVLKPTQSTSPKRNIILPACYDRISQLAETSYSKK